jgi:hypothetical protein
MSTEIRIHVAEPAAEPKVAGPRDSNVCKCGKAKIPHSRECEKCRKDRAAAERATIAALNEHLACGRRPILVVREREYRPYWAYENFQLACGPVDTRPTENNRRVFKIGKPTADQIIEWAEARKAAPVRAGA